MVHSSFVLDNGTAFRVHLYVCCNHPAREAGFSFQAMYHYGRIYRLPRIARPYGSDRGDFPTIVPILDTYEIMMLALGRKPRSDDNDSIMERWDAGE